MKQVQSESEAGLEPRLRVFSKGHSDIKKIKGRHPAQAYHVSLLKEERAWPTAGQQFMAEQDFCTGKNVVLPFPSAKEERYLHYKQWCTYLVRIIPACMYRYGILDQYVCICILYVYTFIYIQIHSI